MRPARKSRERGLYKKCSHLWDSCACPWLGRFQTVQHVNLAKWAGVGKRKLTRGEAIAIIGDMRTAIHAGTFTKRGKAAASSSSASTFGALLDAFELDYVAKRKADGKLRSTSHSYYLAKLRAEFGNERVSALEQTHRRFEQWLDGLTFETGPKGKRITHN